MPSVAIKQDSDLFQKFQQISPEKYQESFSNAAIIKPGEIAFSNQESIQTEIQTYSVSIFAIKKEKGSIVEISVCHAPSYIEEKNIIEF